MIQIIESPTERTTAISDALIAAASLRYAAELIGRRRVAPWKAGLWAGFFLSMSLAGALGATVHGLELSPRRRVILWRPLTLLLGIMVALFAAGAVGDLYGERASRRTLPGLLLSAGGFYLASQRLQRGFLIFIIYEAAAMLFALGTYARLAQGGRLDGAQQMLAGVLLSIIAAAVQTSSLELTILGVPLDNNGLFHTVQLISLPIIAAGLRAALDSPPES